MSRKRCRQWHKLGQLKFMERPADYLVIEEHVDRVRYGLGVSYPEPAGSSTTRSWDNLSWGHFGMNDPAKMGQ